MITHDNEIDAEVFEVVEELRFGGIRECGFSHEHERRVAGFRARFDDEFADVPCTADE